MQSSVCEDIKKDCDDDDKTEIKVVCLCNAMLVKCVISCVKLERFCPLTEYLPIGQK